MSETESKNRPAASGHRFGPDLACSECGVIWDEHQKDPTPCRRGAGEAEFEAEEDADEKVSLLSSAEGGEKR